MNLFLRSLCHCERDISSLRAKRSNPEYNRIMPERIPCVYILASKRNGTLYTGVTSNLQKRLQEHQSETSDGFTKKYHVHTLVYFEVHETMEDAISREKQIKGGSRKKKLALIESVNPTWRDLSGEL